MSSVEVSRALTIPQTSRVSKQDKTIKVEFVLHPEKAEVLIRMGSRTRSLAWVTGRRDEAIPQTEPSREATQRLEPAPGKPSVTIPDHVRRRSVWLFPR